MALATSRTTFGDLARDELAIEVTCPNCGHRRRIDGNAPRLRTGRWRPPPPARPPAPPPGTSLPSRSPVPTAATAGRSTAMHRGCATGRSPAPASVASSAARWVCQPSASSDVGPAASLNLRASCDNVLLGGAMRTTTLLLSLLGLIAWASPSSSQTTKDWITGAPREPMPIKAWPDGKKVAVCFVLYVEFWGKGQGPNFRPDM